MKKLKFNLHLSANEMAGQKFIKLGAYAIVIAVVGYADIAFIQIMSRHFLGGIFGVLSMIGAVATAASILALLFGKANWFRPGPQLVCAYIFTGAEVVVSLANVLLSFELTSNQPLDQAMSIWYNFTAATPFVALIGWILILHFDQSQQDRHEQLEFEEKANKLKREQEHIQLLAQLEHDQQVFDAQMELSETYLAHETAYMQQFVSSPQVQQRLQAGAMKMAMETFSKLTGLPFVAGLSMQSIEQQLPAQQSDIQPSTMAHLMSTNRPYPDTTTWFGLDEHGKQVMRQHPTDKAEMQAIDDELAAFQQWKQSQQSPLQQPPLNTSASQQGMTNGQNGHTNQ